MFVQASMCSTWSEVIGTISTNPSYLEVRAVPCEDLQDVAAANAPYVWHVKDRELRGYVLKPKNNSLMHWFRLFAGGHFCLVRAFIAFLDVMHRTEVMRRHLRFAQQCSRHNENG